MPRIKCGAHRNAEVAIPAGRSHKALHLSILNFSCNEHMFFFTKKKKKKSDSLTSLCCFPHKLFY